MYRAVKYNPAIHHRRSLRLKGYDYSRAGKYFITICCQDHKFRFGIIQNHTMVLNQFGRIAQNEWYKLPDRFYNLQLGAFQVMPNHIHAIIVLHDHTENDTAAGATLAVAPAAVGPIDNDPVAPVDDVYPVAPIDVYPVAPVDDVYPVATDNNFATAGAGASPAPAVSPSNPTVGNIIGAYKSLVANECLKIFKSKNEKMGKLWQRNYYERIIRNDRAFNAISNYILNNPAKWNAKKSIS